MVVRLGLGVWKDYNLVTKVVTWNMLRLGPRIGGYGFEFMIKV